MYRLIGENSSELNTKLDSRDGTKRRLNYLQESAHEGAIPNLAKYYEDKSRTNKNYCLRRFLDQCKSNIPRDFESPQYMNSDLIHYLKKEDPESDLEINNVHELFTLIERILSKEDVVQGIEGLKSLRDKRIAHHDDFRLEPIEQFWSDYEFLLYLARLINASLAYHLFSVVLNAYELKPDEVIDSRVRVNQYWLNQDLKDVLGSEIKDTLPKFSKWYKREKYTKPVS